MKKQKTKVEKPKMHKGVRWTLICLMWLLAFSPALMVMFKLSKAREELPPPEQWTLPSELEASIIFSDDGEKLGTFWQENREVLAYNEITPYATSALVATEDERFAEHSGVDFQGLLRAVSGAALGKDKGGASTISQQLAKLIFTRTDTAVGGVAKDKWERLDQKFKENILAVRLEKKYTKEEIITMYLNQFDFLYNASGIASAAQVYFNTTADSLKMEQAAMLVGMLKNPIAYNPLKNPNDAKNRRNTVIDQWLKNKENPYLGVTIDKKTADSLKELPLETDFQEIDHKEGPAPYFREIVREELQQKLAEKTSLGTYKYAKPDGTPYNIYTDGLRIYTTLDSRLQKHAENAVTKHLTEWQEHFDKNNAKWDNAPFSDKLGGEKFTKEKVNALMVSAMKRTPYYKSQRKANRSHEAIKKEFKEEKIPMKVFSWQGDIDTVLTRWDSIKYYKGFLRSGLISIEPQTGFVKAWVGGPNFKHFAYDHVRQAKRQVGSTIKPFVYTTALQMGVVTPCKEYENVVHWVDMPDGQPNWEPKTGVPDGYDKISVKTALANSFNNITVGIMNTMGATAGPQNLSANLDKMGIKLAPHDVVPAMCLGPMSLSVEQMTAAQATFVNKGIYIKPTTIMRVEDRNGNVIFDLNVEATPVFSEELARDAIELMKGVVNGGTAGSLRGSRPWGGIKYPTAGKTGTTNDNSDGWFMGLTPGLVTGIWTGGEDMAVRFRSMTYGQGARLALPIYGYYMQGVYGDKNIEIPTGPFPTPEFWDATKFNCTKQNDQNPFDVGGGGNGGGFGLN